VKALYALAFVLFSFAAPAQTPQALVAAYYLDDLDCSGETTQQSAVSVQTIPAEPAIEKPGEAMPNQTDDVATTGRNDAEIPVPAIQPGDENAIAADPSRNDDQLADDASQQSVMPAQIIATGPALEKLDEAKPSEAEVATAEPNNVEDAPVEAVQPTDESSPAKHATRSDETPTADDTSGQNAMPAQIIATGPALETPGEAKPSEAEVATAEPNNAEDAPVEAVQPTDESSPAKHETRSDETPTADDTSGQNAMPPQVIATGPTLEKLGEAKPTETDGAATTEPNNAEDAPVEAVQPNDENASVKSDREARN